MQYVRRDEAHPDYHLWSAIVAVASLVGRKVWVTRPYQRIYGNLYVVLVGPQGNRKTAAKNVMQTFLKEVGGIPFSSEATSREQLINEMAAQQVTWEHDGTSDTYAPMTICVTELKEFLAIDPGRMINFLTAIYDSDFFDYSVRGRSQKDVIYNSYLNLLACETPDWITSRLKDGIVSGGFSRRVVYIYQTTHYRYVDKELPQDCKDAYAFLLEDAKRIKELCGEIKLSKECQGFYDHWYVTYQLHEDPAMVGFYESKHTLATKLAMLVCVSEGNSLTIEKPHFDLALQLIDAAEKNMPKVFAGGGRNELSTVAVKMADLLERAGKPLPEQQVLVALFHDCRDQRETESVITHLIRSNKMLRYKLGNTIYLCAPIYAPEDVLRQLGRVDESKSGSAPLDSQPSAPLSIPPSINDLLQEAQQTPPSASAESGAEPQTGERNPVPE